MESAKHNNRPKTKLANALDILSGMLIAFGFVGLIILWLNKLEANRKEQYSVCYGYRYYVISRPGWTDTFNCTDYGEYYDSQDNALKAAKAQISKIKRMVADSNLLVIGGPFTFQTVKPQLK